MCPNCQRDDENDIDDDAEEDKKRKKKKTKTTKKTEITTEGALAALRKVQVYLPDQRTRGERRRSADQSLLLSEGEKEEECKGKNTRESDAVFRVQELQAMLSLPELVARDCVVEEVNWSCAGRAKS